MSIQDEIIRASQIREALSIPDEVKEYTMVEISGREIYGVIHRPETMPIAIDLDRNGTIRSFSVDPQLTATTMLSGYKGRNLSIALSVSKILYNALHSDIGK